MTLPSDIPSRIGSIVMMGFPGSDPQSEEVQSWIKLIHERDIHYVILYRHNIRSPEQLKELIDAIHANKHDHIQIAVDQEGGKVQRLSSKNMCAKDYLSAYEVATTMTEDEAEAYYRPMAKELADYGITINLAPVADLTNHSTPCPVIGGLNRSYGESVDTVVRYVSAFISAHEAYGVKTSIKHFPGHGYANADSHAGMVDITHSYDPIELQPFYEIAKCHPATAFMTAHVMHGEKDPDYPATLSSRFLSDTLGALQEKPLIISDDLQMGAIVQQWDILTALPLALSAGCDMVILSNHPLSSREMRPTWRPSVEEMNAVFDGLYERAEQDPVFYQSLASASDRVHSYWGWNDESDKV